MEDWAPNSLFLWFLGDFVLLEHCNYPISRLGKKEKMEQPARIPIWEHWLVTPAGKSMHGHQVKVELCSAVIPLHLPNSLLTLTVQAHTWRMATRVSAGRLPSYVESYPSMSYNLWKRKENCAVWKNVKHLVLSIKILPSINNRIHLTVRHLKRFILWCSSSYRSKLTLW